MLTGVDIAKSFRDINPVHHHSARFSMANTFSFNPPSLAPFQGEPAYSPHLRPSSSHNALDDDPTRPGTGANPFRYSAGGSHQELHPDEDDPERAHTARASETRTPTLESISDAAAPRLIYGDSHHAGITSPYHFASSAFAGAHYVNSGVNMRNTRPMTAPSSVSAPYFQGSLYSANGLPVSSSFYTPSSYQFALPPQPPRQPSAFQQQVDASNPDEPYRTRNFSLPELVDDGTAPEDRSSYSAGSSPPFLYSGPRLGSAGGFDGAPPSAFHGMPSTSHEAPRPLTGDSNRLPAARPPFGLPGHHPSLYDPTTSAVPYALPSAAPLVPAPNHFPHPQPSNQSSAPSTASSSSSASVHRVHSDGKVYNFISQAGQQSKRPRRRYDEIERLYSCDYPGCSKAYGTLNHLNSHKTMQKHGPKSTPAEFKERRKAWRDNKKQQAAAAAAAAAADRAKSETSEANGAPIRPIPERPRPSTSAGEYHFNVPAPFMSAVGTPIASYPPQQTLTSQTAYALETQAASHPPSWYTSGTAPNAATPVYESYGSVRPLTAPSYYSHVGAGFAFGAGPAAGELQLPPPTGHGYGPLGISSERRMSLPTSQFGFQPDRFPSISEEYDVHTIREGEKVDS